MREPGVEGAGPCACRGAGWGRQAEARLGKGAEAGPHTAP